MNKLSFAWICVIFCVGSCTSRPATAKVTESTIAISIKFVPAFDSGLSIAARREKGRPILLCTVHDQLNDSIVFAKDSVALSEEDWVDFIHAVDTHALRSLQPILQRGMDGVGIWVTYQNDDSTHRFYCWSPNRSDNGGIYKLLDATFDLLYKRMPARENVTEDVQNYLEYGLPVKVKSTKPFIARIYGDLSWGCQTDLQRFFTTVPIDSSAILDLSNFQGMGTLFYPYFKRFGRAHPKTIWIVASRNRQQLLHAGIKEDKMVSSLSQAMALAK